MWSSPSFILVYIIIYYYILSYIIIYYDDYDENYQNYNCYYYCFDYPFFSWLYCCCDSQAKEMGVESFVFDAEVVAFDREKSCLLPFQVLSTRKRKAGDGDDDSQKVRMNYF